MKHLIIEQKKYDWMIDFITAAQTPKTHLELMKELCRNKNEITYFMSEVKRNEIPYTRTRRVHDTWSKYIVLITPEQFKENVEIKLGKKEAEKATAKEKNRKANKTKEILPWYILTTECEVIYFSKVLYKIKKPL